MTGHVCLFIFQWRGPLEGFVWAGLGGFSNLELATPVAKAQGACFYGWTVLRDSQSKPQRHSLEHFELLLSHVHAMRAAGLVQ